jgi:hypothetical protein
MRSRGCDAELMRYPCVRVTAACLAAALVTTPLSSFAAKMAARSGDKPCREAINGLISLLDANSDNTALYRDTFAVVVNTCGLVSPAPKLEGQPVGRTACHDLAAAMVDLIEDGQLNTAAFVKTRNGFAQTCPPR